jgi:hypothetical protein
MHRNELIIEVTKEISDNWILLAVSKKLRYGEYFSVII